KTSLLIRVSEGMPLEREGRIKCVWMKRRQGPRRRRAKRGAARIGPRGEELQMLPAVPRVHQAPRGAVEHGAAAPQGDFTWAAPREGRSPGRCRPRRVLPAIAARLTAEAGTAQLVPGRLRPRPRAYVHTVPRCCDRAL